jgi:tetratricopeptide (TPR) repeat protein
MDRAEADRWRRAWSLCDEAEALDAAALDAWLAGRCAGDSALEAAVRELLGTAAGSAAPVRDTAGPARPSEWPASVGPYDLLEPIGSGGMGLVLRARHRELGRAAAVKLLPTAHADPQGAVERFRREARLLARLDHPGLVRVFEGGRAREAAGREWLWFAMELVESPRTLAEYLHVQAPPWPRRLELLLEICSAVAHAHSAGVLHRDLKPSNVLVDGSGRARVIDFGIGEAIGGGAAALTRAGTVVGTLNYLAPERLDGARGVAQSDVYALGLVLEEAATGRPRFDFPATASGLAELRLAQQRPAPTPTAREPLPRGLHWIVARATDPDPGRRYADAGELAADLRRLQRQEPLQAGPTGLFYRARLFARRNRALVGSLAVVLLALGGGLTAATVAWVREREALHREHDALTRLQQALDGERAARSAAELAADQQRLEARVSASFAGFLRGVFERAPNQDFAGPAYSVDAALDDAWEQSQVVLAGQADPRLRARITALIGTVFLRRLQWARAEELLAAAGDAFEEAGERWTAGYYESAVERHGALLHLGREEEARALEQALLAAPADFPEARLPWLQALNDLFIRWWRLSRDAEGLPLLERLLAAADRSVPGERNLALAATHNLAAALSFEEPQRALELYLEVWAWRSQHEPAVPRTYRSVNGAAEILATSGRPGEGIELLEAALALAADHGLDFSTADVITLAESRAKGLLQLGRLTEAIAGFEQCLAQRRELHGDRNLDVLDVMSSLSSAYGRAQRFDEALDLGRRALELRREEQGPQHLKTLRSLAQVGFLEVERGQVQEGLALLAPAVDELSTVHGPLHPETINARSDWIYALARADRTAEALAAQRELLSQLESGTAIPFVDLGRQWDLLCALLLEEGQHAEAAEAGRTALRHLLSAEFLHPHLVRARSNLCAALLGVGEVEAARRELDRAREEAIELGLPEPAATLRQALEAAEARAEH